MRDRLPRAWVFAGLLRDLSLGGVRALELPDSPRVLFRGESDEVFALDAHCPHMGTHLGHGGRVSGDCLRCPMHGLEFDGTGACSSTAAKRRLPTLDHGPLQLGTHPVSVRAGMVFTWFDPEGGKPDFELPELDDADWLPYRIRSERLALPMEEPLEVHAVDITHNETLHREVDVKPVDPFETTDSQTHASLTMRHPATPAGAMLMKMLGVAGGMVETKVEVTTVGLGYQHIRSTVESMGVEVNQFMLSVPRGVDDIDFHVVYSLRRLRRNELRGLMRMIPLPILQPKVERSGYDELMAAVDEHQRVWAHKRHLATPRLLEGDEQLLAYRRWCDGFYAPSMQTRTSSSVV